MADLRLFDAGVKVFSGNLMYAESVAEGTLAYMLMGLRRLTDYVSRIKQGGWLENEEIWEGLLDQSVGIVGLGTISRMVVQLLQPFRVKVKIFSHYPIEQAFLDKNNAVQTTLEDIFASCKVVSVHAAMNEQTRGMIRREHFSLLQDGALFINTARGKILCEADLIETLQTNRFRAVLDVFYDEPLKTDSPLRALDNVYAIPHMAGPTLDRRPVITLALAEEIRAYFEGRPVRLEIPKDIAMRMTVGG